MKLILIIQARMNSQRLPGKVLKPILGRPMLEYVLERVKKVNKVHEIVLATTVNPEDELLVNLAQRLGVKTFCGSELDVLSRFYYAAKHYKADNVIRITGDCPLIDPNLISLVIDAFQAHEGKYDYASNILKRTYPRGMDTEIFSFRILEEAFLEAKTSFEREHVTPFIYQHPDRYRLRSVEHQISLSKHRWTVDTEEDFQLIQKIIEHLYPLNRDFALEDILQLFELYPKWEAINAHVTQKSN